MTISSLQTGLHCVCPHFVSLCINLKLHKVFVKLTDPDLRGEANEAELVEMGRTWLLVVIYSHLWAFLFPVTMSRNPPGPGFEVFLDPKGYVSMRSKLIFATNSLCIFGRKLYLIGSPPQMICNHATTLETSKFRQPCDALINAYFTLFLSHLWTKLRRSYLFLFFDGRYLAMCT